MSRPADARLREALGVPGLTWIVTRLRQRLESGEPLTGKIGLRNPTKDQRGALERLFGRTVRGASLSVDLAELDALVRAAELSANLTEAVEQLTGARIVDRRAERARNEAEWSRVFSDGHRNVRGPHEALLRRWLAELKETGLLRRLSPGDPIRAAALLAKAVDVAQQLPVAGIHLAELAAKTTGDSHSLDPGMPLSTLVLRAAALVGGMADWNDRSERREAWAKVGVVCDDLSSAVLSLGLSARGTSLTDRALLLHAEAGEPYRLSLRQLSRDRLSLDVGRRVFVCENPAVVSAAASRLGARSAPLICIEGQPSTAARNLLETITATGAELYYHGDFDWAGLRIGNLVMARHRAKSWRFDSEAYEAAPDGTALEGTAVTASWDDKLADMMTRRAVAVHEEALLDVLLPDLAK